MQVNEMPEAIIGEVHKVLGPGLLESALKARDGEPGLTGPPKDLGHIKPKDYREFSRAHHRSKEDAHCTRSKADS